MKVLEVNNLFYSYRTDWLFKKISVLKGLTFSVKEGECFGFLGHNGAGKTTTIKCLLGLLFPDKGEVKVFKKSPSNPDSRRLIGFLPEQPYFYSYLTVAEVVELFGLLAGVKRSEISKKAKETLGRVGLSTRAKAPLKSLSKGLMQRVGLAQALVAKPKLLILDEPFSGLDPVGRKEFIDLFLDEKKRGTTIFISTHILSDVERLCDRALIMAKGEIRRIMSLKDLQHFSAKSFELTLRISGERSLSAFKDAVSKKQYGDILELLFNSEETAYKALQKALKERVVIESFRTVRQSLEDIFLEEVIEDDGK